MFLGTLNVDVALQKNNKILFEESFGDALITLQSRQNMHASKVFQTNQHIINRSHISMS